MNGLLLCPTDSLLRLLVQRDCPTEMSLHNTEDIDTYMHKIIVTGLEFYTYMYTFFFKVQYFNLQGSIFLYHVACQIRDIFRFNQRVNYPSHFRNRLISSCENVEAIIVQYCWHFGELQVVHKHKLKWSF